VADFRDATVFSADHGELVERKAWVGTVSQETLEALKITRTSRSMSVIRTLASIETPLFSQESMSAAASSRRLRLNHRITWLRTRSVGTARSAKRLRKYR
jgi:hypothetical protein